MMILQRDKSEFHKTELSVQQVSLFCSRLIIRVVWSQIGHSVVHDQTTRSDIRPHIKLKWAVGPVIKVSSGVCVDMYGYMGYHTHFITLYCITLTITEPEHCIGGGSSVVQYLKACLERAHVSILTSLQRKHNQVLVRTVLVWLRISTRFNVTCDVTTVLILFTQSFKVVSVEVSEGVIFFLNWVTNLSDE